MKEPLIQCFPCGSVWPQTLRDAQWQFSVTPRVLQKEFFRALFTTSCPSPAVLVPCSWEAVVTVDGGMLAHLLPFHCAPSPSLATLFFWPHAHQQPVYGWAPGGCKEIALFRYAACAGTEQPLKVVKRLPLGVLMKLIVFWELFAVSH